MISPSNRPGASPSQGAAPPLLGTGALFETLFSGCQGLIEIRALRGHEVTREFVLFGDQRLTRLLVRHAAANVYMGVATRRDASGGTLANCRHLGAIFADVDFKKTPEDEARARLAHCLLPPSAIVHSGGGLHVYWYLREPLELPAEATLAKDLLRRLAHELCGDLTSAEPAHVLRVPDTRNHKPEYGTPRPVRLEHLDPTRRYNPDDFDSWLPAGPDVIQRGPFVMPELVEDGVRNSTLYRATRSLRLTGLSEQAVAAAIATENQAKCVPPLPEEEVLKILQNAATQPHAPGFRSPQAREGGPGGHELQGAAKLPRASTPPPLRREAFYGLAGRIVDGIEPTSEADPAAILLHVLIGAGNLIGRTVYAMVEKTRHHCNEFAVLVGQSGKGRKGQAWSTPRALFERVDLEWTAQRVRSGLSSGEGLIQHVRDAREEQQPVKQHGRVVEYQTVVVDPGELDKRLLIFEPELASVLRRMNGETSSLSAVLRQAWESGDLSTLTRRDALRATGAHISVIAHVTREELVANLTETERANGFANRFLFCLVKRSKLLPEGGGAPDSLLAPLVADLREVALPAAAEPRELRRTPAARQMWEAVYGPLSAGEPYLLGAVLGRAEAHVLRLSLLYAALDRATAVDTPHLEAALALWDYAEASARIIFGGRSGMSDLDTLVAAVRTRGTLNDTEISALFHRNKTAEELEALRHLAEQSGLIRKITARPAAGDRGGRPVTTWEAMP